jgi:hypothetical protein
MNLRFPDLSKVAACALESPLSAGTHTHIHTRTYTHTHTHLSRHTHTHTHRHTHTHTHTHTPNIVSKKRPRALDSDLL